MTSSSLEPRRTEGDNRLRIAMLIGGLEGGGAERQFGHLAQGLALAGHDVHIFYFWSSDEALSSYVKVGVTPHLISRRGNGFVASQLDLARRLRAVRPQILYAFLEAGCWRASLLKHFVGNPRLIWGIRNSGVKWGDYPWRVRCVSRVLPFLRWTCDLAICNSEAGRTYAATLGVPEKKMSVIENGIAAPETTEDLKRAGDAFRSEWNIPASDLLIGFLGRNDPMKGVEVLLEAFALVRKQLASVKLVIAGSGFAGISPRELVVDPEVGQNIRLVGVVDPWKGFLAAIDVLVSSSRYGEGFSNSVAEALLAGRAVVCTDSGDSRRIVGDFGQVVEPQNPKAIADGILLQASLATDPELSYQRRAWVEENFGVTRMVERHETAFFRLIAEH